jgi:hypothetical protein
VEKRRLPILKTQGGDDGQPRPPWQWVVFGTLAVFVVWVPLLWVAELVALHMTGVPAFLLLCSALAIGALAGGFVVGRWGQRGVGVREAALAGALAAALASFLSWSRLGMVLVGSLVTVLLSAAAAMLGGWLGVRRRTRLG